MSKLRKHAQLKENRTETEESQESFAQSRRPEQEQRSRPILSIHPPKMKYRDRAALITSSENNVKVESDSNNLSITSSVAEDTRVQDLEIDNYLSKFKDDDDFSGAQRASGHQKKKKKAIRVSNKLFADHNFEDQLEEHPPEQLELVIQRKENRNVDHLLAKVERKAEGFKNRLEFKNAEQDHKVKQDMRHKLKSIQDFEEVKLVIEVPQVAATKHIDGALFLKNVKNSGETEPTLSLQEQETGDIPKDRRLFYENLTKKMKMKKAETLTESVLKECFKKSRLDDNDFVHDPSQPQDQTIDFPKNNNEEQQYFVKQSSQASAHQALSHSTDHQQLPKEEQKSLKTEQVERNRPEPIVQFSLKQQQKKTQQVVNLSQEDLPSINNKPTQKQRQQKKPKKQSGRPRGQKFNVKDLIEEEAEDSDEEGFNRKANQQEQEEDDQGDLSSLIDDDLTLCEEEEEFAHRKFIKDMIQAEQQNFLRMQKRTLQDKHRYEKQHEEQLRKRMQAAAKRHANKEKMEEQQHSHTKTNPPPPSVSDEEESISNVKNVEKLKQLERQIGIAQQKPISQQSSTSEQPTLNKFADLQRLQSIETVQLRQPITAGLKNVQKFKSKPMITTRLRK